MPSKTTSLRKKDVLTIIVHKKEPGHWDYLCENMEEIAEQSEPNQANEEEDNQPGHQEHSEESDPNANQLRKVIPSNNTKSLISIEEPRNNNPKPRNTDDHYFNMKKEKLSEKKNSDKKTNERFFDEMSKDFRALEQSKSKERNRVVAHFDLQGSNSNNDSEENSRDCLIQGMKCTSWKREGIKISEMTLFIFLMICWKCNSEKTMEAKD